MSNTVLRHTKRADDQLGQAAGHAKYRGMNDEATSELLRPWYGRGFVVPSAFIESKTLIIGEGRINTTKSVKEPGPVFLRTRKHPQSASPGSPGRLVRPGRAVLLPVQTAPVTSWCPLRILRRHRRLWSPLSHWGPGHSAAFRCHLHRSCCPFTSSSGSSSNRRPQHPREARRGRSQPELLSDPCVPFRFTSSPMKLTQPIGTTPFHAAQVKPISSDAGS